MHWADWLSLGIGTVLVVRGFRQGLIRQLSVFVAIGLGLVGGLYLHEAALPLLPDLEPAEIQVAVGFAAVFAAIAISVNVVGRVIRKVVHVMFLGLVDRVLGALFGLLIAIQALLVAILLVSRYIPSGIDWLQHTQLAPGLFDLLQQILPLLPNHYGEFFDQHYGDLLP